MTNLPQVPKLPYISGKTLFEDDEKAKEWFEILQKAKLYYGNYCCKTDFDLIRKIKALVK